MSWVDIVYNLIIAISTILFLRWIIRIHAGSDGKLDKAELDKLSAFILFLGSYVYMIYKEANRPPDTEHIFSDIWLLFVMSGILTVLSLDKVLEIMLKFMDALQGIVKNKLNNKDEN